MSTIQISSDVIRGCTDTIILYLLKESPSYAYALSKQIEEVSDGEYSLKETTLYSALTRLERSDYVSSYPQIAESGKKRTYYKITDAGLDYYRDKCKEWKFTRELVEKFVE